MKENFTNNIEREEKMEIKNTTEFRKALANENLEDAEKFLVTVSDSLETFPNYNEDWLDHRQRELFQILYKKKDWQGAKRIVEATKDSYSKAGRISKLEELLGLKYEEI